MLLLRLEVGCAELCLELFKWRESLNFYAFCVLGDQQPLLPSVSSNDTEVCVALVKDA